MSIVVVELAGTKRISQNEDGVRKATRSFFVYDDEGASLVVNDIMFADSMPIVGAPHPDATGLYAASWSMTVSDDRAGAWNVDWQYTPETTTELPSGGSGDESLPFGVQGYNMTVGVTIIDIWKAEPSLPDDLDEPAESDIGGTNVSEGGLPVSMSLPTADIRIRERSIGMFTGDQYLSRVGKRNAANWQGFNAGSVLFTGMNVNHTRDGINEVEYSLAWDKFYHLRQVPERDENGDPVVDETATPPINVYWKQPFKQTTDFSFLPM